MNITSGPENITMQQQNLGLNLRTLRTRMMELVELMNSVVPCSDLVAQVTAVVPPKATRRPPFAYEIMLRLHLLQQVFGLSEFAGLGNNVRLHDRVSILRFHHPLEKHNLSKQFYETVSAMLKARGLMLLNGTVIDAAIIAARSSAKNSSDKRDSVIRYPGDQCGFGGEFRTPSLS